MVTPSSAGAAALATSVSRGARAAAPLLAALFAVGLLRLLAMAGRAESAALSTALLFNALALGLWGTLATMLLVSQTRDRRAWLFALTAVAVSATIVFDTVPAPSPTSPSLFIHLMAGSLIFFFNPPIVMHMCGSIPSRNPLLARYRHLVPAAYGISALLVLGFALAFINALHPFLPSRAGLAEVDAIRLKTVLVAYIISGAIGLILLGRSALTDATLVGRRQAWVVFAGVAPWAVNLLLMLVVPGYAESDTGTLIAELTVLLSALSLFVSIASYRLFEVSSALRRALIYGGAFGLVIGAITLGVQATGTITARMLGGASAWSTIVVLLVGGMIAQPLFAAFARTIDSRLFPERKALEALRRGLIPSLASERSVEGMSRRLVTQLGAALHDAHVTLLLVDVSDSFFRGCATNHATEVLPVIPTEWLELWENELARGHTFPRDQTRESARLRDVLDRAHAEYVMPITLNRRPVGLAFIGQTNGWRIEQSELDLLNDIAQQTSAMLENVRLLDLASNDPLTRLARRHVAEERIAYECERGRRSGSPLSIALVDIDFFKQVNDTHGHSAGDLVLKAVADTLVQASRRIDLVARWGGEEFMLVFPETDVAGALLHTEALRNAVAERVVDLGGTSVQVRISAGVCQVDDEGEATVARATECVDRALYAAKSGGRNMVVKG